MHSSLCVDWLLRTGKSFRFSSCCHFLIAYYRDLKPQNILVTTFPDGKFVLKSMYLEKKRRSAGNNIAILVSDFGFARKMEKETNMQASVLGTPLYMV